MGYGWRGGDMAREGLLTVATAQALRDYPINDLPVVGPVRTLSALAIGDGGGGTWRHVSGAAPGTYTDNLATVLLPAGGDGSAAWHRDFSGPYMANWAGCHPTASPAANTAGLIALADIACDTGGEIHFGPGQYLFSPSTHLDMIPQTAPVVLVGAGRRTTIFSAASPSPSDWILILGDIASAQTHYWGVREIGFAPSARTTQTACNGLRVAPTNRMELKVDARHLTGYGVRLDRPWNCSADVITYSCGSPTANSLLIAASPVDGAPPNDVLLTGTTEQDVLGWRVDNLSAMRLGSTLKIHGGSGTIRPLHLHNVGSGELSILQTNIFSANEHVLISDELSSVHRSLVDSTGTERMRFSLTVQTQSNLSATGGGGGYAVAVDIGNPTSELLIDGFVGTTLDATTRGIQLVAPGVYGAVVDLSGLRFLDTSDPSYRIVDERTAVNTVLSSRGTGLHLPLRNNFVRGNDTASVTGQIEAARVSGGSGLTDQSVLMLSDQGAFTRGVALFQPTQPLSATVIGTISAATPIITGQRLHLPQSASLSATARIVRVTVGEKGVAGTHDPSNHWTVQLYQGTTVVATLTLNWGTYSSAAGDGLPTYRASAGLDTTWHAWDFTRGLPVDLSYAVTNMLTVAAVPVGSPAALSGMTVTIYPEIRI